VSMLGHWIPKLVRLGSSLGDVGKLNFVGRSPLRANRMADVQLLCLQIPVERGVLEEHSRNLIDAQGRGGGDAEAQDCGRLVIVERDVHTHLRISVISTPHLVQISYSEISRGEGAELHWPFRPLMGTEVFCSSQCIGRS